MMYKTCQGVITVPGPEPAGKIETNYTEGLIMRKLINRFGIGACGLALTLPAMAETSALDTAVTELETKAGDVATAAGTVVVAGLAIFAVIFGIRKVKSALRGGS